MDYKEFVEREEEIKRLLLELMLKRPMDCGDLEVNADGEIIEQGGDNE